MRRGIDLPSPLLVPSSGDWIGNDGSWSTFSVQVGTPPQRFQVLPSISGQATYVPLDQDCAPERMNITDCGIKRGVGSFESLQSLGFQRNKSSTWQEVGTYNMGLGATLGLTGVAHYGFDSVSFGLDSNATQVENSVVAAYMTPDIWVGQLGLNPSLVFMNEANQSPSLLQILKENRKIPSLSFGYQAGSLDQFTKVAGSLTLGGYDRSRQSNMTLLVPLNPDLIVGVQSLIVASGNGTTTEILSNGFRATIDSTTPEIWLPASICDELASALGLTYFQEADRYVISEVARSAIKSSPPTFRFVIGTSTKGGSTINIDIPYGAFDLQATFPIFNAPAYYFPLRRAANESQFTLGRAFLQEVYLSVDWERNVFNISQALFHSPPLAQEIVTIEPIDQVEELIPQSGQSGDKTKPLSAGAIAGIAIGSLSFIVLLTIGWWVYSSKRKRERTARRQSDPSGDGPKDEKEVSEPRSGLFDMQKSERGTAPELEGQAIREMYAPFHHDGRMKNKHTGHFTELVEADSEIPMPELAAPIHELPASNEHMQKNM